MAHEEGPGGKAAEMKRGLVLLLALAFVSPAIFPCSVFYFSNGKTVLAGNNEDWRNPFTKIWILPAETGRYGRIYFGYHDGVSQGGVNDRGLFYDGLATPPAKISNSLHKDVFPGNLIDKAMSECATVEEVIALFGRYNLEFMETFMLFFGDRTGDSAIIEGDAVVRKTGLYQIATNFLQSRARPPAVPCDRYLIADGLLKGADNLTVDAARRVLAATHQEGGFPTQYSMIYDLSAGAVYIYHFHNFENVVRIDIREELRKGRRQLDLASLFPRTHAAESFRERIVAELDAQAAAIKVLAVDPKVFRAYAGRYRVVHPELTQDLEVFITEEGDKLLCQVTDMDPCEIKAETETRFFGKTPYEVLGLEFVKGIDGRVKGLILERWGILYPAERVEAREP
jgi:hypothetical protein